jgi:hypothetical protein
VLAVLSRADVQAGGIGVRALFASFDFAISVFVAVAITAGFAFVFDAPPQLVVVMLVLGLFTAITECVMRARQERPRASPRSRK